MIANLGECVCVCGNYKLHVSSALPGRCATNNALLIRIRGAIVSQKLRAC